MSAFLGPAQGVTPFLTSPVSSHPLCVHLVRTSPSPHSEDLSFLPLEPMCSLQEMTSEPSPLPPSFPPLVDVLLVESNLSPNTRGWFVVQG